MLQDSMECGHDGESRNEPQIYENGSYPVESKADLDLSFKFGIITPGNPQGRQLSQK
jgi:hypothetical protein